MAPSRSARCTQVVGYFFFHVLSVRSNETSNEGSHLLGGCNQQGAHISFPSGVNDQDIAIFYSCGRLLHLSVAGGAKLEEKRRFENSAAAVRSSMSLGEAQGSI